MFMTLYLYVPVCSATYYTAIGRLKSPHYPQHYPTKEDCTWIIHVKAGQQIMLNVTDFQIEYSKECRYDYLEIR